MIVICCSVTIYLTSYYTAGSMPQLFYMHLILSYKPSFKYKHTSNNNFNYLYSIFGITSYTTDITGIIKEFNVSMIVAIWAFSLNLLGIAFASVMMFYIIERLGRLPVDLISLGFFNLFILGAF